MERLNSHGVKWLAQVTQLIQIVTKLINNQDGNVWFAVSMLLALRPAIRAPVVQLISRLMSWGTQRGGMVGRPTQETSLVEGAVS